MCCHGDETHAPIANPPNVAQLGGTPTIPSKLHPGPCSIVEMQREIDRQTDTHTDGRDHYTYRLTMPNVKCN